MANNKFHLNFQQLMLKVLPGSQEIQDPQERINFLIDNADAVVEMDYHKSFTEDELNKKRIDLVDKSIREDILEEKIAKFKEEINIELKPLKEETKSLRKELREKGQTVHEKVYQILDEDERMVGFYNSEGILISSRPATKDELQKTIYADLRNNKEGTNN